MSGPDLDAIEAELREVAERATPTRAARYLRAADAIRALRKERDEAAAFVLEFRGIVTAEMVERACMANLHPDTTPSDTERRKMRAALGAANVCESCASVADHWMKRATAAEARVTALEADVARLTAERDTARATNAKLHRRTQVAEGFHQGCLDYVELWQKHTSVKSDFDRGFTYCADVISRFIRYRLTRFNNRADRAAGVRA